MIKYLYTVLQTVLINFLKIPPESRRKINFFSWITFLITHTSGVVQLYAALRYETFLTSRNERKRIDVKL
jgi:hypothetical protein